MRLSSAQVQEMNERNKEINSAFTTLYNAARKTFKNVSYSQIYYQLSQNYSLSEMQVRRIIKGYKRPKDKIKVS